MKDFLIVLFAFACALIGAAVFFGVAYIFVAFVHFNFDTSTWTNSWRAVIVNCSGFGGISGIIVSTIFLEKFE